MRRSAGEPAPHELGSRIVDAILRRLPLEPRGKLRHPIGKLHLRRVPERLRRELHIGEAVANVADARLTRDLRLELAPDDGTELEREVAHSDAPPTADVHSKAVAAVV